VETIQDMIDTIAAEARGAAPWTGSATISAEVLAAMALVPRDEFVPEALKDSAYADGALPIGHGQTISQPYIVALMTDLLRLEPGSVVLEVGSGSGYQAAVLSRLADKVYGMENIAALAQAADKRLHRLGYDNVEIIWGNGFNGLPEHAPYDGILVAAAAEYIPPALIEQLKPGGRMVIPVGRRYLGQDLKLLEKSPEGDIESKTVLPVAFVPLIDQILSEDSIEA
jgi:protein-L-isoaspartate(D-aspartate) O-methyltransferase